LNIYIYGNNGFKKDIHETLEHANIKFKLDDDSEIKDIDELEELKAAIESNPNDIYLIDDEKIIKKNKLSQKIKFLAPKDGIEEEFLLDNGIADLSVDSLKEIPKYIIRKHEQLKANEADDIQNSIIEIVEDAYSEDDDMNFELDDELSKLLASDGIESLNDEEIKTEEFEQNSTISNEETSIEQVESMGEIDNLLAEDETDVSTNVNLDEMDNLMSSISDDEEEEELSKEELSSIINFDEDVGLNNVSHDYDDQSTVQENSDESKDDIDEQIDSLDSDSLDDDFLKELENIENIDIEDDNTQEDLDLESQDIEDLELKDDKIEEVTKGDSMSDEFSELDGLNEKDILEALNGFENVKAVKADAPAVVSDNTNEKVSLESSNVDDLAGLISKLLNNKTLEITIKIKD